MTEELRRVLAAATPGPWHTELETQARGKPWRVVASARSIICRVGRDDMPYVPADAALIAAAVNAAPALLAVADAARELEAATIALDAYDGPSFSDISDPLARDDAARAALWAALAALGATR